MKKDIRLNVLPVESTLRDVLSTLNRGVFGIVFIVDQVDQVVGIFTDGDVRRSLLRDAHLDSRVEEYMKRDFTFARAGRSKESYIKMLSENIRHLPILDKEGRLVDFLSWAEMWRTPVMEPTLGGNELKYVSDCITSNWISSQGSYVTAFEETFSKHHNVAFALTTSSGTTALHLALVVLGIGPGDEVIVPDLTFAACANTVLHAGAKPVFVDVSEEHWTIDPRKIEDAISANTKAVMPVHLYGHPCDMDPILDIARKHGLYVIEDCAEALGARYRNRLVGTMGDVACFSFFSNKVITTGEGGMVMTCSPELYEKMMVWRDHGMTKSKRYWHEVPGFNYRMTNLQAAVGLAQMEQVETFLEKRRVVAMAYEEGLRDIKGVTLPPEMTWARNVYWLYSIIVDEDQLGISRDALMKGLEREGVETRPFFFPLHSQKPYLDRDGRFPVTDRLATQGLSLPSSAGLSSEGIDRLCKKLMKVVEHHRILGQAQKE